MGQPQKAPALPLNPQGNRAESSSDFRLRRVRRAWQVAPPLMWPLRKRVLCFSQP